MNQSETENSNEYEFMDTLALLRLYHKATVELNSVTLNSVPNPGPDTDKDVRTFETNKMTAVEDKYAQQRKIMDETKKVLMSRGAKFNHYGIDLANSSEEIQKLVKENEPE